ncbi:MAG TPA: aldo/keto reductase [Miltoncostaeaceae bacterium]|nr:aldo/keto reductase [Miltoncostaeaceae bacterium]
MTGGPSQDLLAGAPAVRLANEVLMPVLGLGAWRVPADETEQAVLWAMEAGYRHIDTAAAYGNEEGVGRGLRASGLPREDVFVTTKLRPGRGEARRQLEDSLRKLGFDRVDLYLIHWPGRGADALWPDMQRLHGEGLARAIGVSNYGTDLLRRTVERAEVPPMVNQVEWHPQVWSPSALRAHRELGVVLESYSPLGHGRMLADPAIAAIAGRLGRTPAQVLVRWCLQHGVPTIPKSRSRERIAENADVLDWALGEEDMARLDALRGG